MARLAVVIGALGLSVVANGCARDNPAFGAGLTDDDTTRGDDVTDATRPGTTPGDDADPTDATQTDDGSGPSTSADAGDSSSAAADTADDSGDTTTACELGPKPFTVELTTVNDEVLPIPCGETRVLAGPTEPGGDNQLWITECGGGCECPKGAPTTSVRFEGLDPSPAAPVMDLALDCVHLALAFGPEPECAPSWVVAEPVDASEQPIFLATNSAAPTWGLFVPTPALGDPLEVCEDSMCGGMTPTGTYALQLANSEPLAPGDSVVMTLDPYANGPQTYEVTALFARVDQACTTAIGWSATLD